MKKALLHTFKEYNIPFNFHHICTHTVYYVQKKRDLKYISSQKMFCLHFRQCRELICFFFRPMCPIQQIFPHLLSCGQHNKINIPLLDKCHYWRIPTFLLFQRQTQNVGFSFTFRSGDSGPIWGWHQIYFNQSLINKI